MKKRRFATVITICAVLLFVSAAVVFGMANAGSKGNGSASYFDSLNDFDWSRTCPGAVCRNDD